MLSSEAMIGYSSVIPRDGRRQLHRGFSRTMVEYEGLHTPPFEEILKSF